MGNCIFMFNSAKFEKKALLKINIFKKVAYNTNRLITYDLE